MNVGSEYSDKSKYPSRYSDGYVTAAQYVTELICEQKAKNEGKDLPKKFWKHKDWAQFFRAQVWSANQLLKSYSPKVVIAAIKESPKTYSLRNKFLLQKIKQLDGTIKESKAVAPKVEKKTDLPRTREKRFEKTIIDKLKDLE